MTVDYQVRFVPFRNGSVHEMVVTNADGSYTIFIDPNQSCNMQRRSFAHALLHIKNSDFEKDSADQIEFLAHQ